MSFAVLQWAGTHHIAEHPAEMGGAGKAGLFGHRTDGKLSRFQQLLGRFDAAVVDIIHDGLARYPPEQTAQVAAQIRSTVSLWGRATALLSAMHSCST